MELKAELDNYTQQQRIDFIMKYNRSLGYEIKEMPTHIEAWGYTEDEKLQHERERINNLNCTKRVFAIALEKYGVTYTQLKELIATNERAQLEWDLCVELQRSNPLLDIMAVQLNITPKQLDDIFKEANGEK